MVLPFVTSSTGHSVYCGWVGGSDNGNFSLLYVLKMSYGGVSPRT